MDVKLKIAPPTLKTLSTAALEDGIVKTLLQKKKTRHIRFELGAFYYRSFYYTYSKTFFFKANFS